MAAIAIGGDYRRTDQRTNVLAVPFWLTSGVVSCADCTAKAALLFSFPTAGQIIFVHEVVVQNIVAATAGNTVDIGSGTLATNAITTGGNCEIVDLDEYWDQTDYVVTAGVIQGVTTGTDWQAQMITGAFTSPRYILGVATTTVPCVYATIGTAIAGTFRVHMLITILPGT